MFFSRFRSMTRSHLQKKTHQISLKSGVSSLNVCHYCILLHSKSRVKNVLKYLPMKKVDFLRVCRTTYNYIFYPCSGHCIYAVLPTISRKIAQDHTASQSGVRVSVLTRYVLTLQLETELRVKNLKVFAHF